MFEETGLNLKKKNLAINCDFCDATKIKEEDYEGYEKILLNADMVMTDERSRSILTRLPIVMNVDKVFEAEDGVTYHRQVVNGNFEINEQTEADEGTLLVVNGGLIIAPGSGEALNRYHGIVVNGNVTCPKNLWERHGSITVNGFVNTYPEDCTLLEGNFAMDKYFPLRVRENGKYYAAEKVIMAAADIDISMLARKNVRFVTKELLLREEKVEDAVSLVDETVKFTVIPEGYSYVPGDAVLDERFLEKYGSRLFIDGNLTIEEAGAAVLPRVEGLKVMGNVSLHRRDLELFGRTDAEYDELEILKGRQIKNAVNVSLDAGALEREPEGILIHNVASLKLAEDIPAEMILERLEIINCAKVYCSRAQESAVAMVGKNIAKIDSGAAGDGAEEQRNPLEDVAAVFSNLARTKVINADEYIL